MEKFEKFMLLTTIILLIILGLIFLPKSKNTSRLNVYETKRGEMGAVTVEITPLNSTEYEVVFNTHSVELDFDFTKIIKLEDNLENIYDAKTWSGGRGGHHLQGEIVFPDINTEAQDVTITISGIENKLLSFEWVL